MIFTYDDAYLAGDFERKKKREARLRELSKCCYTVEFPVQSHASLMNWAGRRLAAAGVDGRRRRRSTICCRGATTR